MKQIWELSHKDFKISGSSISLPCSWIWRRDFQSTGSIRGRQGNTGHNKGWSELAQAWYRSRPRQVLQSFQPVQRNRGWENERCQCAQITDSLWTSLTVHVNNLQSAYTVKVAGRWGGNLLLPKLLPGFEGASINSTPAITLSSAVFQSLDCTMATMLCLIVHPPLVSRPVSWVLFQANPLLFLRANCTRNNIEVSLNCAWWPCTQQCWAIADLSVCTSLTSHLRSVILYTHQPPLSSYIARPTFAGYSIKSWHFQTQLVFD